MWLTATHTDDMVHMTVHAHSYIKSQPVEYEQVRPMIEYVQKVKLPVVAFVDVSDICVTDVNLYGVVEIIHVLHQKTKGDRYLKRIVFIGLGDRALRVWKSLQFLLPGFVRRVVCFEACLNGATEDVRQTEHRRLS